MNIFYEKRLVRVVDGEKPSTNAVDNTGVQVASDAIDALKEGATMVAGLEVPTPEKAADNMEEAFRSVRSVFGSKFRLDELYFQQFRGNIVGESKESGTFVDPIMLMHPAKRMAHVIAHELAHDKRRVMNEALVESYVSLWFGDDGSEDVYEGAVAKFENLAKLFDRKYESEGNAEEGTKNMYELYYAGNPKGLYEELMEGLTPDEQEEAHDLFVIVFPEIVYVHHNKAVDDEEFVDGECHIKILEEDEYELTGEIEAKVDAQVEAVKDKEE